MAGREVDVEDLNVVDVSAEESASLEVMVTVVDEETGESTTHTRRMSSEAFAMMNGDPDGVLESADAVHD